MFDRYKKLIRDYNEFPKEVAADECPINTNVDDVDDADESVEQAPARNSLRIAPIIILSFTLEFLSSADLVSDIYIMIGLSQSGHLAWFTITLFTMVCPFLMGYGSLITLRINHIIKMQDEKF
jgi:hypothetical protein